MTMHQEEVICCTSSPVSFGTPDRLSQVLSDEAQDVTQKKKVREHPFGHCQTTASCALWAHAMRAFEDVFQAQSRTHACAP